MLRYDSELILKPGNHNFQPIALGETYLGGVISLRDKVTQVSLNLAGCTAVWQFRLDPRSKGEPDFEWRTGGVLTLGLGSIAIAANTPLVDVSGDYHHELWIDHPGFKLRYLRGIFPIELAVRKL